MSYRDRLVELNRRGLIHAPDESDESFFLRCRHASPVHSPPSSPRVAELFDVMPDWVWTVYENKGLRMWEGGCTWIEKDHVTLQLKKVFLNKKKFLGYSREEIMAHELVHVVRRNFEEPIFEEILAYQTSGSAFRRYFGPILRSTKETSFFLIVLLLSFIALMFSSFQLFAYAGILGLVIAGSVRLVRAQTIFFRTRKKLTQLVGKERSLPILLRLTDREIIRFSKMPRDEILDYARKMRKIHIRWQQITAAYFEVL